MPDSKYTEVKELHKQTPQLLPSQGGIRHDAAYFNDRLLDEIARSKRYKYNFSVLFIEMDNMDAYALKYGDSGQDQLSKLRTILADSLRNTDIICHFEESKFGVVLPYCSSMQARIVAERIRGNIARIFMPVSLSTNIRLTSSIGLATYPEDALSRELLLTGVSYALSMAKARGGNHVCLVSEPAEQTGHASAEKHAADVSFMQFLDGEVARCSRYGQYFSIAILAVSSAEENLTNLESDMRHKIMQAVHKLINETLRDTDRCFQYAVDKWAMLLSNTGPDGALICAQKLFQSLKASDRVRHYGQVIRISANMGIASFPVDDISKEGLVHLAEVALAESFGNGTNQFKMASTPPELLGSSDSNVKKWIAQLSGARKGSAYALLSAVDLIENYARPHSYGVARYAVATGQALGLPHNLVRQLRIIGQLHDIGKKCIPAGIITKPAALDSQECEIMRKHPQYGAAILGQFPDLSSCAAAVHAHHERWDGQGYPQGLKGDQIPLEARIISVAEAFDDMIIKRPYQQAMTIQHAIEELSRCSGTQFDPAVAKAFTTAISSLKEI